MHEHCTLVREKSQTEWNVPSSNEQQQQQKHSEGEISMVTTAMKNPEAVFLSLSLSLYVEMELLHPSIVSLCCNRRERERWGINNVYSIDSKFQYDLLVLLWQKQANYNEPPLLLRYSHYLKIYYISMATVMLSLQLKENTHQQLYEKGSFTSMICLFVSLLNV